MKFDSCPTVFNHLFAELANQAGLADARLTAEQDNLALSILCLFPMPEQQSQFLLSSDERCQPAAGGRFKPALNTALAEHSINPHGSRNPFELLRTEVIAVKETSDESISGGTDRYRVGFGHLCWIRAAIFGVSPTTADDSRRLPTPISPTTTSPV